MNYHRLMAFIFILVCFSMANQISLAAKPSPCNCPISSDASKKPFNCKVKVKNLSSTADDSAMSQITFNITSSSRSCSRIDFTIIGLAYNTSTKKIGKSKILNSSLYAIDGEQSLVMNWPKGFEHPEIKITQCIVCNIPGDIDISVYEKELVEPEMVFKSPPVYPKEAQQKRLCGWVNIVYDVAISGRPENVRVENSSSAIFEVAALKSVQNYRFKPASNGSTLKAFNGMKARLIFEVEDGCNNVIDNS